MNLNDAIQGFLLESRINLAPSTVTLYATNLRILSARFPGREVESIKPGELVAHLLWLKTEYKAVRNASSTAGERISSATLHNHWKALRSFFNWCEVSLDIPSPAAKLPQPRVEAREVVPFTREEVEKIVKACDRIKHPNSSRDKAVVLLLLDTGIRVGELCRIKIEDLDLETGQLLIRPHGTGQKTKPRILRVGKNCRRAIWLFLAKRKKYQPEDPLFELTTAATRAVFWRLGQAAGVRDVHPHRFRHTFAIEFLRNTRDIFTLQYYLDHSTSDMVRHYTHMLYEDYERSHEIGSPSDNWKLK